MKNLTSLFLVKLCMATCANLPVFASHAQIAFSDVSEQVGIDANYMYGTSTVHGLGLNAIDFDNDGWVDLFIVNGIGEQPHLYHNNGDGTFTKVDHLLPALPNVDLNNSVYADYDNDGDLDIYIFTDDNNFELNGEDNPPDGPLNILLKNLWVENGNMPSSPLFEDVATLAGVDGSIIPALGDKPGKRAFTGGWFDFNRDGWPDIHAGNMVLQAPDHIGNRNTLWQNNGGTFSDVTDSAHFDDNSFRPSLASFAGHLNDDMWPDVYSVNVHELDEFHHDYILINQGNNEFVESSGTSVGVGDDSGSGMGIDVADIDLDGDWDIYMSDIYYTSNDESEGNILYLSNGDGTYTDNVALAAGIDGDNSWGINFFDMDHDGYQDLLVSTMPGASMNSKVGGGVLPDLFYRNDGDGTFTYLSEDMGLVDDTNSRGAVHADFDNDGDLDVAIVRHNGPLQVFYNNSVLVGGALKLKLTGAGPSDNELSTGLDAIGTLVKVTVGEKKMMRQVVAGSSAHSQNDLVVHFGVGDVALVDEIAIHWPSGMIETLTNIQADTFLPITEGQTLPFTPDDVDGDGVANSVDACPMTANSTCELVGSPDADLDGVVNLDDNCPFVVNGSQTDTDNDGIGDACDDENNAPLNIASVFPEGIVQGATTTVAVTGSGFVEGMTATVCVNAAIAVDSVTVIDQSNALVDITVAPNQVPRNCSLVFNTPDGSQDVYWPLLVLLPIDISQASPNEITMGSSLDVVISGQGFMNGASLSICNDGRVSVDALTVVSSTTIEASISVGENVSTRPCTLAVTNPQGSLATIWPFVINESVPSEPLTFTGATPTELAKGATTLITVSGTGFGSQTSMRVCRREGGVVTNLTVIDGNTLTANVFVPTNAPSVNCPIILANGANETFSDIVFSIVE